MVRRNNLLTTDAVREVKNTFSRFLSILVLSALAVAFLTGLRATTPDMKYTADNYFDRTHMMDASVISTLGITGEDLEALAAEEGVETVEGVRTVDVTAVDCIVSIRSVPEKLNLLEVEEGRLPQAENECVTDPLLLAQLGLEIGDTLTVTLEEGDADALIRTAYTVVGTVICPLYAGTDRGTTSLGDGSLDGVVFVPGENFTADYYSIAYLTGTGLAALDSYSQAYDDAAEALLDRLETLGAQRAQLRYDQVVGSAQAALDNTRTEAETRLADAKVELDSTRAQLDRGWQDYRNAQAALTQSVSRGRAELENVAQALNSAQAEYDAGLAQYHDGLAQYNAGLAEYENSLNAFSPGTHQLAESKARLDAGKKALDEVHAQLNEALTAIVQGWAEYHSNAAALDQAEKAGRAELERTLAELNRGGGSLHQQSNSLPGKPGKGGPGDRRGPGQTGGSPGSDRENGREQMVCAGPQRQQRLCGLCPGRGAGQQSGQRFPDYLLPGSGPGLPHHHDPHGGGAACPDWRPEGPGLFPAGYLQKISGLRHFR